MRRREAVEHLGAEPRELRRSGCARGDPTPEIHAVEELFDEVQRSVRGLAAVEHVDDAGVRERRRRAGLARKAGLGAGRGRELGADQLDGDTPVRERVQGLVHDAHAAHADEPKQTVFVGQRGPDASLRIAGDERRAVVVLVVDANGLAHGCVPGHCAQRSSGNEMFGTAMACDGSSSSMDSRYATICRICTCPSGDWS